MLDIVRSRFAIEDELVVDFVGPLPRERLPLSDPIIPHHGLVDQGMHVGFEMRVLPVLFLGDDRLVVDFLEACLEDR